MNLTVNRFVTALGFASAALFPTLALAQAKAVEPDYTLSYNLGLTSDYRYRGLSQTGRDPALQGGVDFAHKDGFYLGAWGSTISWIKDTAPGLIKGPVEIDLYGGYKGTAGELSYDVGLLQYWYTGNSMAKLSTANANTLEAYGALTMGVFTAKYSHSLSNLFGTANSKNSSYLDLSATFELSKGLTLTPHVGQQRIKGLGRYTDWSLTVAKDLDGLVLSAAVVGTDWKSRFGAPLTLPGSGGADLARNALVVGIKKNF